MDWLRSEDLKEEMELTASTNYSRSQSVHSLVKTLCSAGKTPNLIDIDQPARVVWRGWARLLMDLQKEACMGSRPFPEIP